MYSFPSLPTLLFSSVPIFAPLLSTSHTLRQTVLKVGLACCVVVDPDGDDAQAAFLFPQTANCRRFGRARDAMTDDDDDDPSEFDLSA